MALTRRSFITSTTGSLTVFARSIRAQERDVEFAFRQYHNQTPESSLHKRLVQMWQAVYDESGGRLVCKVFAQNNSIQGSDPAALKALVSGEIDFFTLMGGILGTILPVAEVQQVPYAFQSAADAHRAMDGPLGAYTFKAFGCEPVIINSDNIYAALEDGRADAQENPLTLAEQFRLYEVVKYVAMTDHMWSGFNLLAHLPTWQKVPADLQAVIDRNVTKHVRLQRQDQIAANTRLRTELAARGLQFNTPDAAPFRKQLAGVYAAWKEKLGTKCWRLLE